MMENKTVLFYDLETTSADVEEARIVQYSLHMIPFENGTLCYNKPYRTKTDLVNPRMTIPVEAIGVHGITDEMVKDKATFSTHAPEILEWIDQADAIGGYNIRTYDNVVLENEMGRAGIQIELKEKPCLDGFKMINQLFPRSLTGMVKMFLGLDMESKAHDADEDTKYTAMLVGDVIRRIGGINLEGVNNQFFGDELDLGGKLVFNEEGEPVFTFGKYEYKRSGQTLVDVAAIDSGYLKWMLGQEFPADFKQILRGALVGKVPVKEINPT